MSQSGKLATMPREKMPQRCILLQYIDQYILEDTKVRREHKAIKWIDFKNAYDIVSKNWIIDCLKMYKIPEKVINFTTKAMKNKKVKLTAGEKTKVKCIFAIDICNSNDTTQLHS